MNCSVIYRRDKSGWWQARVPSIRGCHTPGRTVEEARRRIREALGLFVDDADDAKLVDVIQLPAAAKRAVVSYARRRKVVDAGQIRATAAARRAIAALHRGSLRLSTRD